jgi:hydroxymethylbilane synthase
MAGLKRLGLESRVTEVLDPSISVPAVGQGALAIECRVDDQSTGEIVAALQHAESALAATAERGFLERLGGGCQVPLGAYAEIKGARIALRAFVGDPDGTRAITGRREGPVGEAESLGRLLAEDLIGKGANEILAAIGGSGMTY